MALAFENNATPPTSESIKTSTTKTAQLVDVVKNYTWAVPGSDKSDVPYIEFIEYQQTSSSLRASAGYWARAINQIGLEDIDPYKGLYIAEATGWAYRFPYLNPYDHIISNRWGENRGFLENLAQNTAAEIMRVFRPSAGVEAPYSWQGPAVNVYNFSFNLLNTVTEANSESNIQQNFALKNRLIRANLQQRTSAIVTWPPVIYEVTIPGIRYSPAAVMRNVNIQNVGQMNLIGGFTVPDAWNITIEVQELISESESIFEGALGGDKVTAIVATSKGEEVLKELGNTPPSEGSNSEA